MKSHAVIAGAGIGGLTAAAPGPAGWRVTVCEQARSCSGRAGQSGPDCAAPSQSESDCDVIGESEPRGSPAPPHSGTKWRHRDRAGAERAAGAGLHRSTPRAHDRNLKARCGDRTGVAGRGTDRASI